MSPQRPRLSVPGDVAPVPQVLHEAVEEQRVSLRALLEQGRELVREAVRDERGVEIGAHAGREQPPQSSLPSVGPQVEEAVIHCGVGPLEVGVAKRDEEEDALSLVLEAMGKVADEVDAREIGPLEVLGQDHHRELPRGRVESVGHLAEHAFLVGAHHLALQVGGVPREGGGSCRHQVGANVRRICRVRSAPRPTMRLLIPSRKGRKASPLPYCSAQPPRRTVITSRARVRRRNSATRADLPMPGSPTMKWRLPAPATDCLSAASREASSAARPTKAEAVGSGAGCCGPSSRLKPSPHPFERAHADRRSASGDDRDWPGGLSSTAPSLDARRA